ncbi:hypothetical protein H0H93_006363 [Arthromyces matolae]|nr:hypothetical protein H0H93_006363 [Arthromyces matolae]
MPSIRSIFVFAATALTAFVAASPAASFANVQAVPDALTAAKSQLLALQADVEKAINAGSVTDAEAANAYIDKMASIVSGAKASYKASNVQASNTALSASSNADLVSSLEALLTEVVQAVGQLLSSLLGSVSISAREAVVAKASATLELVLTVQYRIFIDGTPGIWDLQQTALI